MTIFPQDDSQQFAELLLRDGAIRSEDWQIAESIQKVQGGRLLEILLGLCPLSEEELYRAIARQLDYPFWTEQDLMQFEIPSDLLFRFPVTIALECDFLPIKWEERARRLHIIIPNPLDTPTLDAIQMYAQAQELVIGVSTPSHVVTAIQVHYKQSTHSRENEQVEEFFGTYNEPQEGDFFSGQSGHSIAPPKIQMRECPACHNMEPVDADICSRCSSPMDLADADPLLGKVIKGFRLTQKLGEGGMGLVYGAQHTESKKEAAVKILRTHLSSNERVVRRFHREAQAQNQLRHPNIVHVHDFGFEKGVGFFIAMEFLRGLSMEEILESHIHLITMHFIRRVLRQVCDAMGLAHSHGIFHRDLKPDNIFLLQDRHGEVDRQPHVKILDFGVAKMVASDEDQRLTRTGMTIGTPRYMAPEQAGDGNTDHRSDIYSLGVILFEMLTGNPPFEGSSAYQIMLRHVYADPPALSHIRPDLPFPPNLEDFLLRALAKNPQDRPASMDMFWQELAPALNQLETFLPEHVPLHGTPQTGRKDAFPEAPSLSTEAPVLVGRIYTEQNNPTPLIYSPPPAAPITPSPPMSSTMPPMSPMPPTMSPTMPPMSSTMPPMSPMPPTMSPTMPPMPPLEPLPSLPQEPPEAMSYPWQRNAEPTTPLPPHKDQLSSHISSSVHNWLEDDELDEWESGLGFQNQEPHALEEHNYQEMAYAETMAPSSILPDSLFSSPPSSPPQDPLRAAPPSPIPKSASPFTVPEASVKIRSTPIDKMPSFSAPSLSGSGTGNYPPFEAHSQEALPMAMKQVTTPKSVSLRSSPGGRTTQRTRFSNALKQGEKKEKSTNYLLLIVVGLLLFGGGLMATWLFLIRGG